MSAPRVGRCLRCDLELPFVAFSRSQQNKLRAKKPATCIRCCDNRPSPEELEQQQKGRVAQWLYEESYGQVDGMQRRTKGGGTSLAAQPPTAQDSVDAGVIKYAFSETFCVATASYESFLQADLTARRAELTDYAVGTSEHANARAELETVEAAAARVQAMEQLLPNEPYRIGGWRQCTQTSVNNRNNKIIIVSF